MHGYQPVIKELTSKKKNIQSVVFAVAGRKKFFLQKGNIFFFIIEIKNVKYKIIILHYENI